MAYIERLAQLENTIMLKVVDYTISISKKTPQSQLARKLHNVYQLVYKTRKKQLKFWKLSREQLQEEEIQQKE